MGLISEEPEEELLEVRLHDVQREIWLALRNHPNKLAGKGGWQTRGRAIRDRSPADGSYILLTEPKTHKGHGLDDVTYFQRCITRADAKGYEKEYASIVENAHPEFTGLRKETRTPSTKAPNSGPRPSLFRELR